MNLTPGKLWGLRRMADSRGIFKMTAVDQRPPIEEPIAKHLGTGMAPWNQVARFKALLVETLQAKSTAMLLDPHYAIPQAIGMLSPTKGLIVTLENSEFGETAGGRLSTSIDDWSVGKIKRMGGDAVKVLAWYRPDAARSVTSRQQDYVKRIGGECVRFDIPFLLELLVYPMAEDIRQTREYTEMSGKRSEHVLASVEEFAKPDYGVDMFKLESPVGASGADGSAEVQGLFDELGQLARRPWVMLSAGAGKSEFKAVLEHAFAAGASGFLAGRAIWFDAFRAYPDWGAIRTQLKDSAVSYMAEICDLADNHASNWAAHPCFGTDGARFRPSNSSFRHVYPGFGSLS
ncbi:MAG: tagatose 1,6-diphosphate aldolase [Paracoccaceae bacterium]|nr:tagatose 1,6-diphosphate aldolase [Paracoccaceae bacterium]